jgi:hypothetical protein
LGLASSWWCPAEHLGTIERSKILAACKHFEKLGVPYVAPIETLTNDLSTLQSE